MKIAYKLAEALARPAAHRPGEFLATGGLGPQIAPAANSGGYTLTINGGTAGSVTQDASGIHFIGANNLAAATKSSAGLADNTTYELTFTVANRTGGTVRVLLYGPTSNHLASGTSRSANGTYTERLTTSNTGSNLNEIRIQATGTNGTNSFDITSISVKKVLP